MYDVKAIFGYHVGLHSSFRVQKRFFLHTSLIYSTKGMDMKGKENVGYAVEDDIDKFTIRLQYIEIPILYTVYLKGTISGRVFKYSLGVGPNVSYWLKGKGVLDNTDVHEFGTGTMNYTVDFGASPLPGSENKMAVQYPNRIQLGVNLATTFLFEPAPQREILLTLRYEFGHSYLASEGKGTFEPISFYQQNLNMRNQGFRISLAYMIDLQIEKRKKGKSTNDPKKRRY